MKKMFCTLVTVFTALAAGALSVDAIVKKIRADYIVIENNIKKKKFTKKYVEYTAEKADQYGSVTRFDVTGKKEFSKWHLQTVFYEQNTYDYYFYTKNEKLFFVYHVSQVGKYTKDKYITYKGEERYYFDKGKLVRHLSRQYALDEKTMRAKPSPVPGVTEKVTKAVEKDIFKKFAAAKAILNNPSTPQRVLY